MADLPTKEQMAQMSHSDLIQLRDKNPSKEAQDAIAPYEHRAFAREYVAENPVTGTLGMIGAIPGYQVAKAAGLTKSRSGASVDQAVEAAKGVGEGVAKAADKIVNPWEIDWNPVGQKALEAIKTAVEPVKQAVASILPWQQDWSAKRPVEAPMPIQEQAKPQFKFADVFQKLIQAESGGVHETAPGELIKSNLKKDPARGITQLRDSTANNPGYGITPVQDNSKAEYLRVGQQVLNAYTNDLGGDIRKGVAAYNWGIGNMKKAIMKYGDNWEQYAPAETKKYLKKVLS